MSIIIVFYTGKIKISPTSRSKQKRPLRWAVPVRTIPVVGRF